ncbi:zinc metalloprotease HtpX [Candidatus Woesebacteria bacterium]|nr:zinc metalloprotease HtpX [Candidatus Woesebacteria bacterium]
MFFFTIFVVAVSYIFALAMGFQGMGALGYVGIALIIVGIINFSAYYWSDKMVLKLSKAKAVSKKEAPQLYRIVENLAIGAGVPKPKIYIIHDDTPNAFATGRDPKHAAIAVHTGLLERLNKLEIEGVIAHELSHIRNFDTRVMAIVAILVGTIALLAEFFFYSMFWGRGGDRDSKAGSIFMILGIVAAILAPIVAQLIQLAVSRRREFLADASAGFLTRYPEGLARALEKISNVATPAKTAHTSTAHLYISSPLGGKKAKKNWMVGLFNTHPPIEERVKALRGMR